MTDLAALLDGKEAGRVHNDARGRLTFVYDDAWRNAADRGSSRAAVVDVEIDRPGVGGSCLKTT